MTLSRGTDTVLPPHDEFDYDESDDCETCGGEGWILESEAGPSEWMEDTYCGTEDSTITCRACKGTGVRK